MEKNEYDKLAKVLIIGNDQTGKTYFLQRYFEDYFEELYKPTIGLEFRSKIIVLKDKRIKLQIWDTSGQEKYKSFTTSYYKLANIIILLYDITSKESFESLESYIKDIDDLSKIQICIFGNKSDLIDDDSNLRAVDSQAASKLASKYNALFMEVSAKSNTNIDSAINEAISCLLTKMD